MLVASFDEMLVPSEIVVPEMENLCATRGILFGGYTFGRIYVLCIYSHAR